MPDVRPLGSFYGLSHVASRSERVVTEFLTLCFSPSGSAGL